MLPTQICEWLRAFMGKWSCTNFSSCCSKGPPPVAIYWYHYTMGIHCTTIPSIQKYRKCAEGNTDPRMTCGCMQAIKYTTGLHFFVASQYSKAFAGKFVFVCFFALFSLHRRDHKHQKAAAILIAAAVCTHARIQYEFVLVPLAFVLIWLDFFTQSTGWKQCTVPRYATDKTDRRNFSFLCHALHCITQWAPRQNTSSIEYDPP